MKRTTDLVLSSINLDTEYPEVMPFPRPGIDLDGGKSVFTPELYREAIRNALPAFHAECYIEEVEYQKGEDYWNQFSDPADAVHDAMIYFDAVSEGEPIQTPYKCQGWNL